MKSKHVELTLGVLMETPKAWHVSALGERVSGVWLPKAMVERCDDTAKNEGLGIWSYLFVIPEALAFEKGLI